MAELTVRQKGERRRYLRKKIKAGSASELEQAEYELLTRPEGTQPDSPAADDAKDDEPTEATSEAAAQAAPAQTTTETPKPPPIPPAPFPPAAPLPKPPRVTPAHDEPVHAKAERIPPKHWQDKYREADGGDGRESICVEVADAACGLLQFMADQIKLSGVDPVIDPSKAPWLRAAWILTLDQVLPDRVRSTPQMKVVAGSSALLVQRFLKRKEIAAAQKTAEDRAKHDEFRRKQHDPQPTAAPEPAHQAPEPPEAKPRDVGAPIVARDATGGEWTQEMIDSLSEADRNMIFPKAPDASTLPQSSAVHTFDPEDII